MSSLIYNGISIDVVRTHEVAFTPVFDVDNTYLYTKVGITISGLVNPKATSYLGTIGGPLPFQGQSPTASVQAIRHALLQARAPLVYDSGGSPGSPLVVSPLAGMPCDANNGPLPGGLTVTKVNGTKTYHVHFSVETWVVECYGIEPTALISNRYGQAHSVDELHYTTIVTTGQALFRTDLLEKAGETADKYRSFVLPPVPGGFQRKAIDVAITPARNALTYRVVDREKPFDLANRRGVVDCKATYEVSSTGTQDGGVVSMMTLHRVQVQAFGDKASSNWEMTKFCIELAQSRLPIGQANGGFVRQVGVTQSLTERSVGLVVVMMLVPKKQGPLGAVDVDMLRVDEVFGDQGGRNPNMPNRKGAAGTYANEIVVAAWKAACQSPPPTDEGDYAPGNPYPYTSPGSPVVRVYPVDDLPPYQTRYSDGTTQRPYTDYKVTTEHETHTGRMQVPLAGPAGEPGYKSGGGDGSPGGGGAGAFAAGGGGAGGRSDRPDCAFLTLARPMHRRVVRWTAERVGMVPEVPSPNTTDRNLVLVDAGRVVTEAPSLLPDGDTLCYRVSGVYTFGLRRPTAGEYGLAMGAMPWIDGSYRDNRIPGIAFVTGIIDDGEGGEPVEGGDEGEDA